MRFGLRNHGLFPGERTPLNPGPEPVPAPRCEDKTLSAAAPPSPHNQHTAPEAIASSQGSWRAKSPPASPRPYEYEDPLTKRILQRRPDPAAFSQDSDSPEALRDVRPSCLPHIYTRGRPKSSRKTSQNGRNLRPVALYLGQPGHGPTCVHSRCNRPSPMP